MTSSAPPSPAPHVYQRSDEAFYVAEGRVTFTRDREEMGTAGGCHPQAGLVRPPSITETLWLQGQLSNGRAECPEGAGILRG